MKSLPFHKKYKNEIVVGLIVYLFLLLKDLLK